MKIDYSKINNRLNRRKSLYAVDGRQLLNFRWRQDSAGHWLCWRRMTWLSVGLFKSLASLNLVAGPKKDQAKSRPSSLVSGLISGSRQVRSKMRIQNTIELWSYNWIKSISPAARIIQRLPQRNSLVVELSSFSFARAEQPQQPFEAASIPHSLQTRTASNSAQPTLLCLNAAAWEGSSWKNCELSEFSQSC
jgi:hypothetical protein